jgi:hypothetical protein
VCGYFYFFFDAIVMLESNTILGVVLANSHPFLAQVPAWPLKYSQADCGDADGEEPTNSSAGAATGGPDSCSPVNSKILLRAFYWLAC